MFKISNAISGLNKSTLPTELIPLNSIQLSRGLLNYAVIQSKMSWIYPYWVNKQYNPKDNSFIPRSHSGLSINLTQRNWTAIGNPDCIFEPTVDPRGLVTPFPNGWSIDTWLFSNNKIYYPSSAASCGQRLIDDLPVVETIFDFEGIFLKLTSYTEKDLLVHKAEIENRSASSKDCRIIISIRPFNTEGVGIADSISFDLNKNKFLVNNNEQIFFNVKPDLIHCSDFNNGDAAEVFTKEVNGKNNFFSECPYGLASAIAVFNKSMGNNDIYTVQTCCNLNGVSPVNSIKNEIPYSVSINYWNNILGDSASINTPDPKLNSILKASLSTLLMLTDGESITPGPFTYHQFWFRDAAFMIFALDKFGFDKYTAQIVKSFPKHQLSSGYFRSQKGEWDSNGQVLWTVYNHYLISKDKDLIENLFESLYAGVKWIDHFRITQKEFLKENYYGLLPKGISAEHLGHADHYFWDNFWSLAGIKSFINICTILKKEKEKTYAENLFNVYNSYVEKAIASVQKKYMIKEIPASPSRNIDCGMIGSICASYPLQLLHPKDQRVTSTLETLYNKYFYDGLFFQQFIHSGLNPYLTLHAAHSYLYSGNRKKFWEIFSSVLSKASGTLNYPEAIHPITGGGVMGDGHHGWVAAELVSAARDAFIFENEEIQETVILQGIPKEWFENGRRFSLRNSPLISGIISIFVEASDNAVRIKIDFLKKSQIQTEFIWRISVPLELSEVRENSSSIDFIPHDDFCEIVISAESCELILFKSKIPASLVPKQS